MKNEKSNHKTEGLPIKREDRIHLIQQHVLDTLGLSYVPKRTADCPQFFIAINRLLALETQIRLAELITPEEEAEFIFEVLHDTVVPEIEANSMGFRISAYGQTKESAKYLLDKHMPNLTVGLIITSYFTDKYKEIADLDLPTALILSY